MSAVILVGAEFAAKVGGVITDTTSGATIAGASVEVSDEAGDFWATSTDGAGAYEVNGLPLGKDFQLVVSSSGYTSSTATVSVPLAIPPLPVQRDLSLTPGCGGFSMVSPPNESIPAVCTPPLIQGSVDILNASGGQFTTVPLQGATVQLIDANAQTVESITTDASGSYTIDLVADGTYTLHFSRQATNAESRTGTVGPTPTQIGSARILI